MVAKAMPLGSQGDGGWGSCWALPEMLRVGRHFLKAALTSGLPSHTSYCAQEIGQRIYSPSLLM